MTRRTWIVFLLLLMPWTVAAQDMPQVEIFGGYSHFWMPSHFAPGFGFDDTTETAGLNGWNVTATGNLNRWVGMDADLIPGSLWADDSGPDKVASTPPRWETGFIFSVTTFGTAVSTGNIKTGIGGRVTFNANRAVGFEYQTTYFPGERSENGKIQGSGHLKLTCRAEAQRRINLFGIIGPGFLHESDTYTGGHGSYTYEYRSIALVYGGGIEIMPHRHVLIRLDLADFYAGTEYGGGSRYWAHHLDFKASVMLRF